MRARNRFAAACGAVALVGAGLVATTVAPASAVAISGGCATFPGNLTVAEGSAPAASHFALNGPWSDDSASDPSIPKAEYELTSTGGSAPNETRNFTLTYDKGLVSFVAASDVDYHWYFSVNGTMLPKIVQTGNELPEGVPAAAGEVQGSFVINGAGPQTIALEKLIVDTGMGVSVVCSGQTGSTAQSNPHSAPVATNVTTSFTSYAVATATIKDITNQATLTNARFGDVISFEASDFSAAGSGTAQICNPNGGACTGTAGTFTVDANGEGSGTLTVPGALFNPGAGAKELRLTSNGEVGKTPIRIMGAPVITTNLAAGGAGSVVTVTGTNYDPGQPITVYGSTGTGQTDPATTDPAITVVADANGAFSAQYTVNDPDTTVILAYHTYRMPPGNTGSFVVPGNAAFEFSGDACVAKQGAAQTGDCALLQTVTLDVTAGNLTMAKEPGNVVLDGVTLNGTPQTTTGDIREVTVKDYRGGMLGWSLVGTFDGLSGPVDIAASALTWTPECDPQANNDDDVVAGGTASFGGPDALALCSVATTGLGADGTSGGDTIANAGLELAVPANQAAGSYTGTLTLTLS